jgi:nanoRNase/pAp phosphatase (c-di-AMP/oligoRNAs hydrolase)
MIRKATSHAPCQPCFELSQLSPLTNYFLPTLGVVVSHVLNLVAFVSMFVIRWDHSVVGMVVVAVPDDAIVTEYDVCIHHCLHRMAVSIAAFAIIAPSASSECTLVHQSFQESVATAAILFLGGIVVSRKRGHYWNRPKKTVEYCSISSCHHHRRKRQHHSHSETHRM